MLVIYVDVFPSAPGFARVCLKRKITKKIERAKTNIVNNTGNNIRRATKKTTTTTLSGSFSQQKSPIQQEFSSQAFRSTFCLKRDAQITGWVNTVWSVMETYVLTPRPALTQLNWWHQRHMKHNFWYFFQSVEPYKKPGSLAAAQSTSEPANSLNSGFKSTLPEKAKNQHRNGTHKQLLKFSV